MTIGQQLSIPDEMVERAARTMADLRYDNATWDDLSTYIQGEFLADARAVLKAAFEGGEIRMATRRTLDSTPLMPVSEAGHHLVVKLP